MMSVLKWVLNRLGLLLSITLMSFFLMQLAPGDPTAHLMDPQLSVEDQTQLRESLGLDKPIIVQYWVWLSHAVQGDFGYSTQTHQPVLEMIGQRLPATLLLSVTSLVLIVLITLPLGLLSAARKDKPTDFVITLLTFIGLSLPTFWVGLMLIWGLALEWDLFPTSGYLNPSLAGATWWRQAQSIGYHMALPLITTLIGGLAGLTRYHRLGVISILEQPYILAARARGISLWRLYSKHALKNAALPVATILGLSIPGLIGGSFIIEFIFSWPGMGQLGINAVFARDYPVLMCTLLLSSILIILGNSLADAAYRLLDPRIGDRQQ